jgi:hypothetical protein
LPVYSFRSHRSIGQSKIEFLSPFACLRIARLCPLTSYKSLDLLSETSTVFFRYLPPNPPPTAQCPSAIANHSVHGAAIRYLPAICRHCPDAARASLHHQLKAPNAREVRLSDAPARLSTHNTRASLQPLTVSHMHTIASRVTPVMARSVKLHTQSACTNNRSHSIADLLRGGPCLWGILRRALRSPT